MRESSHSLARLAAILVTIAWAVAVTPALRTAAAGQAQDAPAVKTTIAFAEVIPILDALREELIPGELKTKTPPELEIVWPRWLSTRDAAIRARVSAGDEDSIVHFLLFGTTFTTRPRATEAEREAIVLKPAEGLAALRPRVVDLITGMASPGGNERLQFARTVLERDGIDVTTEAGKARALEYLERRLQAVGTDAAQRSAAVDVRPNTSTLYQDRGLSSDTSIAIDYGIDRTLEALKARGVLAAGAVRRVAIIGPGLDFSDKLEGYDFYPQQTIQPFAVVDSLLRHGLATANDLQITALDLSPRVIQHLDAARMRASSGTGYQVVLPRSTQRPWTAGLVRYWQQFGDRIGQPAAAPPTPPSAGPVDVRSVVVRPDVVALTRTNDVNIVLERLAGPAATSGFDVIIATNLLVYYDVFEQSLAAVNVAKMLRDGGVFLSNNQIAEVPGVPLHTTGYTDTVYTEAAGGAQTGDRVLWYQR